MSLLRFGWSKDPGTILWINAMCLLFLVFVFLGEGHWVGGLLLTTVQAVYWLKTAQWQRKLQAHERELLDFADHVLRNQPKSSTGRVTGHDLIRFRTMHATGK
jgi:hypothetical protein